MKSPEENKSNRDGPLRNSKKQAVNYAAQLTRLGNFPNDYNHIYLENGCERVFYRFMGEGYRARKALKKWTEQTLHEFLNELQIEVISKS